MWKKIVDFFKVDCPNCSLKIKKTTNICPHCGIKTPWGQDICQQCRFPISLDDSFCPNCGQKLIRIKVTEKECKRHDCHGHHQH